jgi:hypothetical protein
MLRFTDPKNLQALKASEYHILANYHLLLFTEVCTLNTLSSAAVFV